MILYLPIPALQEDTFLTDPNPLEEILQNSMARPGRSEVVSEEKVTIPIEFRPDTPLPANAEVGVEYIINPPQRAGAVFNEMVDLGRVGDVFKEDITFDSGARYRYRFVIAEPGKDLVYFPRTAPGYIERIAQAALEPSPAPTLPADRVRTELKARVNQILQALRTQEGAEGLEALVDNLSLNMEAMGMRGDHLAFLLRVASDTIAESNALPEDIRSLFRNQPMPADFNELQERINRGAVLFRRKVFNRLRANRQAREALHLEPRSTGFSHNDAGDAFHRITQEFVPGRDAVGYFGFAMQSVSHVPPNRPDLTRRRQQLMRTVLARLTPRQRREIVGGAPAHRIARFAQLGYQLGFGALLLTGAAPVAGALGLLGASALRQLTGVSERDIVDEVQEGGRGRGRRREGDIVSVLARNNIASKMWTTRGSAWDVVKNRFKGWLLNSIPGSALFIGGRPVGEGPTAAHEAEISPEGEEVHEEAEHPDIEELIRTACRQEMGIAGGGGGWDGGRGAAAPDAHH